MREAGLTTTCNRPGCGAWLDQVEPDPQRDQRPDAVRCAKGHIFPVLERRTAPGGQHAYKLGPEDTGARFAARRG
jgi:hypothetical protein